MNPYDNSIIELKTNGLAYDVVESRGARYLKAHLELTP